MTWLKIAAYTLAGVLAIPVSLATSFFLIQWRRTYLVPSHLPWAGLKNRRFFAKTRASMREANAKRNPIIEGYEEFAKQDKAFVLPTMHWPDVALPPSQNGWLISQPDSVLSTVETQDELLMLKYFGHGPNQAAEHDWSILTRDLTRQMGRLMPELREEIEACFEEEFRTEGEEWKELSLYEAVELAARRGVNRIFVGSPMCRDKTFMKIAFRASMAFALCGAILRTFVPGFLTRVLAPLVGLPFFYQRWRLKRLLLTTITQRMNALQQPDTTVKESPKANDGLQWIISSAYRPQSNTFALDTSNIAGKTLLLNFFAVFTTSITTGTVLYDILLHQPANNTPTATSPSNADLLAQLREEAAAIIPKLEQDPTAVRQMTKLDSVIRETLRYDPMFARGIQRKVMQPSGITTPSGLYLPQGTHVCALISPMQRDPAFLAGADKYQPLRYYKPTSTTDPTCPAEKQVGAVQISESFLSFSLGKHACPGRFFAVQTMKVMLAWLLLNYDFEIIVPEGKTEPEWLEVGEARLPPQEKKGKVRVRRRKVEGDERYRDEDEVQSEKEGQNLLA